VTLVFVDTNVIAYARDNGEPTKQAIAERWLAGLARSRAGRISWQVLIEFYAVATNPRKLAINADLARADIENLQTWHPIAPDGALLKSAWRLSDRYGLSWWDSQIVAAALRADCSVLLSEDLSHGQVVEDVLRIVNPFAPDAEPPPEA
jgi:predicted nucleic acid-binding protein